jgi:hypothetical protein
MAKSPLQQVKDTFETKAKLVEAVKALTTDALWLGRTSAAKGLEHVSNAKLLRLHKVFTSVKDQFGSRDALIGAILDLEKRTKDDGYKARLTTFPVPRLFDMHRSAKKRAAAAAKAPPKPAKAEKTAKAPKAAKAAKAAKPAKA